MLKEFQEMCDCIVLRSASTSNMKRLFLRGTIKLTGEDIFLKRKLKGLRDFDTVFFNTIASFEVLPLIQKRAGNTFLAYLHEQSYLIERYYKPLIFSPYVQAIDKFFVASGYTKEYLTTAHAIEQSKVEVTPPFINIQPSFDKDFKEDEKSRDKTLIIGACGLVIWHKGPDLFIQVAAFLQKHYPQIKVKFIWVGATDPMKSEIEHDIKKSGLSECVKFPGKTNDISEYFNTFDLFLLTSRDDSFPLVVLEACEFGLPVICFKGVGDIEKLVSSIPENVVPYSDVEAMAKRIVYYNDNQDKIRVHGKVLKGNIAQYNVNSGAKNIYQQFWTQRIHH